MSKTQALLDYVPGYQILFQVHSLIRWAISTLVSSSFFSSLSWSVKICLCFLRFAAPSGSNKQPTCFLGCSSTFAAPSLPQRPYHYPHKQQKCLCNLSVGGISSSSRLCSGSLDWMQKKSHRKRYAGDKCSEVVVPWEDGQKEGIYVELTDTSKLPRACLPCEESCRLISKWSLTWYWTRLLTGVSQVVSADVQRGNKCFWLQSQKAIDSSHWVL